MCTSNHNYQTVKYSKSGDTMHTCNGDVRSGLPFGKKAPEGTCKRCDELRNGSKPRQTMQSFKKEMEQREIEAIKNHNCKISGCGIVCTFGDW